MFAKLARFAARNGARKLDRNLPGWAAEVEPARLDFKSSEYCVLGQAYGDFWRGMGDVSYVPYADDSKMPDHHKTVVAIPLVVAFGRFIFWNGFLGGYRHYDRALKEAWTEEVARREMVVEPTHLERSIQERARV